VHAVLQTVDLATGAGLVDAAAAQAAAEGVLGREAVVAALARSALAAPAVVEAAACPHWREVYVAAPVGDTLLEGYIDLLYRAPDGLVVVDYKTDHLPDDASLDARLSHYSRQGAAYALAVERVTGQPVSRCVFVFCSPAGARQREVDDLRDVIASLAADLGPAASPSRRRGR
jgi:ATP-dependent exoDNAse (exonuclease V) beta subunit